MIGITRQLVPPTGVIFFRRIVFKFSFRKFTIGETMIRSSTSLLGRDCQAFKGGFDARYDFETVGRL